MTQRVSLDRLTRLQMPKKDITEFAICVRSDDPDLLTPRMIYPVLPDASAARSNYIRVVDNEGEDYLYPANYFLCVDFPRGIERALRHVSPRSTPRSPPARRVISFRQRKLKQHSA